MQGSAENALPIMAMLLRSQDTFNIYRNTAGANQSVIRTFARYTSLKCSFANELLYLNGKKKKIPTETEISFL